MKNVIVLLSLVFTVACGSSPTRTESPRREPASGPSSTFPVDTKMSALFYQGPLEINVDGATRTAAKSYLPIDHTMAKKWPLVVVLHGFSGTGEFADFYLGMRSRVSSRGFVLLSPEGTKTPAGTPAPPPETGDLGGKQFWSATDNCCDFGGTGVDDSGYLQALIEKAKKAYNIDPNRVYLIGHSNGGFMVNRLGCDAGKTFAGIASLAGGTYKDLRNCRSPEAVRYLQIHAEDDDRILYGDHPEYSGAKATVGHWISKNGCSATPTQGPKHDFVWKIDGIDTSVQSWKNCRSKKIVELWTIKSHKGEFHNPHIPIFHFSGIFTEAVLDFFFAR